MNLVFEAVTNHSVTFETLWDIAKNYRLDYNRRRANNNYRRCTTIFGQLITYTDYLQYFSNSLNINFILKKSPVYKKQITDSLFTLGFQLFQYIASCADYDNQLATNTYLTYINSFKRDPARTIFEAAINLYNFDVKKRVGRDMWKKSSGEKLMKRMNEIFGLNTDKLKVFSYAADNLEEIKDDNLKKVIKACIEKNLCEELRGIVENQGTV